MYQISATEVTILVGAVVIGLYYWLLQRKGILKAEQASPDSSSPFYNNDDILPRKLLTQSTEQHEMTLPEETEPILYYEEDEADLEFIDTDEDTTLLKETEQIVERIQETINHIASNPANPEEITSKIKVIVLPYQFLLDTDYYDSINTYIALAVQRDCNIILKPDELSSLWHTS